MAEIKLFETPQFHDAAFYKDIPMAPHWDQAGHGERLRMTFVRIAEILLQHPEVRTVADWGCGNGRLIQELWRMFPEHLFWGYDLLPANVRHAEARQVVPVTYHDFVNEVSNAGNLTILTEVLEHLIDPRGLLRRLRDDPACQWIVASSPAHETADLHYEYHNWVWTEDSYPRMFTDVGFKIDCWMTFAGAQIVVARKLP